QYFPYICALHILLDYLIDQHEDKVGGDLNFCFYYPNEQTKKSRIAYIAQKARACAEQLTDRRFHKMIVDGLLALYLSDPKVKHQPEVNRIAKKLLRSSAWTGLFFWLNSKWIRNAL